MSLIEAFLRRPTAILKMPEMIAQGLSAEGIIKALKEQGLSYRRTVMLGDIRSVKGIEAKKDAMKYVRKDRIPSMRAMADVEWDISEEYMYKVKVRARTSPDEPLTERFVTILSDNPLTPRQVEQQVMSRWGEWEKYSPERIEGLTVTGAYHRIESEETE